MDMNLSQINGQKVEKSEELSIQINTFQSYINRPKEWMRDHRPAILIDLDSDFSILN